MRRPMIIGLARLVLAIAFVGLLANGILCGDSPDRDETSSAAPTDAKLESHLGHFYKVAPRIFCGPQPVDVKAFELLGQGGVRLVVSVDGSRPNVELAKRHGMRYCHIPLGYDGVSREEALQLAAAVEQHEGRIYFHCHHGRHRAPAAAAVAAVMHGVITKSEARSLLARAKTGREYVGLWKAVEDSMPAGPHESADPLVEVAPVDSTVTVMARVSRRYDELTMGRVSAKEMARGLSTSGHLLLLLEEDFRELARNASEECDKGENEWLQEHYQKLAEDFRQLRKERVDEPLLVERLHKLKTSCASCHDRVRN